MTICAGHTASADLVRLVIFCLQSKTRTLSWISHVCFDGHYSVRRNRIQKATHNTENAPETQIKLRTIWHLDGEMNLAEWRIKFPANVRKTLSILYIKRYANSSRYITYSIYVILLSRSNILRLCMCIYVCICICICVYNIHTSINHWLITMFRLRSFTVRKICCVAHRLYKVVQNGIYLGKCNCTLLHHKNIPLSVGIKEKNASSRCDLPLHDRGIFLLHTPCVIDSINRIGISKMHCVRSR